MNLSKEGEEILFNIGTRDEINELKSEFKVYKTIK